MHPASSAFVPTVLPAVPSPGRRSHGSQPASGEGRAGVAEGGATIAAAPLLYAPALAAKPAPPHDPKPPTEARPPTVPSNSAPGLLGQQLKQHDQQRRDRQRSRPLRESRSELRAKETASGVVQDVLREVKGLQMGFAQSLEGNMPWVPQVEQQRQGIRRQYLSLLFGFPHEADLSLVDAHWMQTTHAVIARYRAHPALKAALSPSSTAAAPTKSSSRGGKGRTSAANSATAPAGGPSQEQRVLVKRFSQFLSTEIGQYQQLEVRLALSCSLVEVEGYLPWLSNGQFTGALPAPSADDPDQPRTAEERQRKLAMFVKGLIFLGDLERYREVYSPARTSKSVKGGEGSGGGRRGRQTTASAPDIAAEQTDGKFEKAREYYDTARLIMPENGNPFNQLATISTYLRDRFTSTYYFLRALAVKESFVTARGNLQATLKGPLEAHRLASGDAAPTLASDPSEKGLQKNVVVVLAMLLLRSAYDPALVEATIDHFRSLVAARALSAEVVLRTLVSFLAVHWDARLTRPVPRGADAKASPKVDAEALALEVILDLVTALFETAMNDLVDTLSAEDAATLHGSGSLLGDETDDAAPGSPSIGDNLNKSSRHLSAVLRRSLATLRVAAKWVRAHQDYLARVLQKQSARGAAEAPVVTKARDMFAAYVGLANALAVAFPVGNLCPLEGPLEEDLELRGFGPLRKLFPASTPVSSAHPEDGHPNEEQFMRVWDLHHEMLLLVGMESSCVFIDRGRFAVVSLLWGAFTAAQLSPAATAAIVAPDSATLARAPFDLAQRPQSAVEGANDIEIVGDATVKTTSRSPGDAVEITFLPATHESSAGTVENELEAELNFAEMDLEDDPVDAAMRAALGDSDEFDSDEEAQLGMTMSMHGWGEVEERILWPPASAKKSPATMVAPSPPTLDVPPRSSGITALDLLQQLGSPSALNNVPQTRLSPAFASSPGQFGGKPLPGARGDSIWGVRSAAADGQTDPHRSRTTSLAPSGWGDMLESGIVSPSTGFGLPLTESWTRPGAGSPHSGLGNGGFGNGHSPFGQPQQQQQQQSSESPSLDGFSQHAHQQNAFGQYTAQRSSVPGVPGAPYGPTSSFTAPGLASHLPQQQLASPITNGSRSPWG